MTDLTLTRGDSRNYLITITEADLVTPVDLTDSVIKFAIKKFDCSSSNIGEDTLVFKTSYRASEIEITDAVNGAATIKLEVEDTYNDKPGVHNWDTELTRKGALATSAGTIDVVTDSGTLAGTGLDFSSIRVGDILEPAGVAAANQNVVTITAKDSTAGTLTTDYTDWSTETGISIDIYRGDRKTPTGLSGDYTLNSDVVV